VVKGLGGKITNAGTHEKPLEIFVGNAGTAARFLTPLLCLGQGAYLLHGVARMHERPQAALFSALRDLGYKIESSNDKLPAVIQGTGPRAGKCRVSIEESSQFASGLLLCARVGGWQVEISGENPEESPYVVMTRELIKSFPAGGGEFQIEPDASSGSYFIAAGPPKLSVRRVPVESPPAHRFVFLPAWRQSVTVAQWPRSGWQPDELFPFVMCSVPDNAGMTIDSLKEPLPLHETPQETAAELKKTRAGGTSPSQLISRRTHLGDSIMTAIVVAPLAKESWKFTDLGRLRLQECERVVALRTELTKCGAKVIESGDTLEVFPSTLHGAEIETYNDHRMAMCFSILGLKISGIKIKNPACVKKTFPNFYQKLATPPPHGLGATILEAATGRRLGVEELFAD